MGHLLVFYIQRGKEKQTAQEKKCFLASWLEAKFSFHSFLFFFSSAQIKGRKKMTPRLLEAPDFIRRAV